MGHFVRALIILVGLALAAITGTHVAVILFFSRELDRVFSLDQGQDMLFIGGSNAGCSIYQSKEFHNKVVWISAALPQDSLVRLLEFERRGLVDRVRVVGIPFYIRDPYTQISSRMPRSWYHGLPLTWRYLSVYPMTLSFLADYLRLHQSSLFQIEISSFHPDRRGLAGRSKKWKDRFKKRIAGKARNYLKNHLVMPDADANLVRTYERMRDVCKKHGVRFVIFKAPLLPYFYNRFPEVCKAQEQEWLRRFEKMGIEVLDPQVDLRECDFFDEAHLVHSGAKKYTRKLYEMLDAGIRFGSERNKCYNSPMSRIFARLGLMERCRVVK